MSQSAFSCQNNDNFNIFEGKVKLTAIAPEWSYADGKNSHSNILIVSQIYLLFLKYAYCFCVMLGLESTANILKPQSGSL